MGNWTESPASDCGQLQPVWAGIVKAMTNQQSPEIAPLAPELWALGGWPLGASVDPLGGHCTTFAVFAVNATRVQLEIYPAALGADASSYN